MRSIHTSSWSSWSYFRVHSPRRVYVRFVHIPWQNICLLAFAFRWDCEHIALCKVNKCNAMIITWCVIFIFLGKLDWYIPCFATSDGVYWERSWCQTQSKNVWRSWERALFLPRKLILLCSKRLSESGQNSEFSLPLTRSCGRCLPLNTRLSSYIILRGIFYVYKQRKRLGKGFHLVCTSLKRSCL